MWRRKRRWLRLREAKGRREWWAQERERKAKLAEEERLKFVSELPPGWRRRCYNSSGIFVGTVGKLYTDRVLRRLLNNIHSYL